MNQKDQDKFKKIVSIILLISWCLIIYYFSNQNGNLSTTSSSHLIDFINKLLRINLYDFEYSVLIVRKLAHMFLYFILFVLSYNCFLNFKINKKYLYAIIFCLLYSISDEVHQLFIIERTANIIDIVIDMLGSFMGLSFCKLFKFN
ncbi:MAG: VanZ family protein [Bacilli bacterium]|nr:VanZ family protein [Bacilli bacterium]